MDTLPVDPKHRSLLPWDLYNLSLEVYKPAGKGEAAVQAWAKDHGLKLKEDKHLSKNVRMVVATNEHLGCGDITLVVGLRGTDTDEVDNVMQDFSLLVHKLLDKQGKLKPALEVVEYLQEYLPRIKPAADSGSSARNVQVYITGHSLGGVVAETAAVKCVLSNITAGMRLHCLSFESTGLQPHVFKEALAKHNMAYWEQIINGYLATPNPINTLLHHLGTTIHVLTPWSNTAGHMFKCFIASGARVAAGVGLGVGVVAAGAALAAPAAATAAASATAGAAAAAAAAEGAAAAAGAATAAAGAAASGAAATGMSAAAAAGWAMTSAIAAGLGVSAHDVLLQHKLKAMGQCFNPATGELKPECCCVMHTWPHTERSETVSNLAGVVGKALLPSFICKENHGFATMLDRTGMLHARCRNIPGYVTAKDHAASRDSMAIVPVRKPDSSGQDHSVLDAAFMAGRAGAGSLSLASGKAAHQQQLVVSKRAAVKVCQEVGAVPSASGPDNSAEHTKGHVRGLMANLRL